MDQNNPELQRLKRIERYARYALCGLPLVFFVQVLALTIAAPGFAEMYMEFGDTLPLGTRLLFKWRFAWLLVSALLAFLPFYLFRKREMTGWAMAGTLMLGLIHFAFAQYLTLCLFAPIFADSALNAP